MGRKAIFLALVHRGILPIRWFHWVYGNLVERRKIEGEKSKKRAMAMLERVQTESIGMPSAFSGALPGKRESLRDIFGEGCGHTWTETFSVEVLFSLHLDLKRVYEIGMANGHFSIYLANICFVRGAEFTTFEINAEFIDPAAYRILKLLGHRVRFGDCFAKSNIDFLKDQLGAPGRAILLCDGGDKIKETKAFASFLKSGDLLIVDDWGTEVLDADVSEFLRELRFEPVMLGFLEQFGAQHRFFIRR